MKNEYEATFLNVDHSSLRRQIKSHNGILKKKRTLCSRLIFENEVTNKNKSWVRLRDEGDKISLTLKQVNNEDIIDGTKEIEFTVSDLDLTKEFLLGLGLQCVRYQQNYREQWQLDGASIDLDEWPDLEPYVEIEAHSKAEVRKLSEKLGFRWDDAVYGSVDKIYRQVKGRDILKESTLLFTKSK